MTLVPWRSGRCLTWDATVVDASEAATSRKTAKYAAIANTHIFIPVAAETLGPLSNDTVNFIEDLGSRLSNLSDDPRETNFLFQRISILIQRYNAVSFSGTFAEEIDHEG